MLLVKDKQGHVFGGYASEPWLKNGKYYGEVITSMCTTSANMFGPLALGCFLRIISKNFVILPMPFGQLCPMCVTCCSPAFSSSGV